MPEATCLDDLMSIRAFARRYPEIGTEASLRWQIYRAEDNGLAQSGAVIRMGRKILLNVPLYRDWLLHSCHS